MADAYHAEYGHQDGTPVIAVLECSIFGQTINLSVTPGTKLEASYGAGTSVSESTKCNYGLRPDLADIAASGGMCVAAVDKTGEVRAIERPDHPFFVATLYLPQLASIPDHPHPLFRSFVQALP